MEIIATQKFILMSPKKIRPVADVAKKMKPKDAIEKLLFTNKKAARELIKVIKSALSNAKNKGISDENLFFKEIQIGEGPRLKRGIAVSRGQWHPIKKRMSHIRVVLETREEVKEAKKEEKPKKELARTLKEEKKGKKGIK